MASVSSYQLRDQLGYLYSQIISVLTHSQMTKIFEQRNNFDLRGLIGGTEIFLDSLGKLMNTYPGFMLSAIQCLTVPRELRDKVGGVLGRARCKVQYRPPVCMIHLDFIIILA